MSSTFAFQSMAYRMHHRHAMGYAFLFTSLVFLLLSFGIGSTSAQQLTKNPEWVYKDVENPESAYYDRNSRRLFISNVAGIPNARNGRGWISELTPDGKVIKWKWADGLNAPKGMRSFNGLLWVTDIDRVLAYEISTSILKHTIFIPDAKFLNDIAIDAGGTVYVSDTLKSAIFQVKGETATLFLEGPELQSPNGLLIEGGQLWVAAFGLTTDWTTVTPGTVYSIDLKTKKLTPLLKSPLGNLDGLEMDQRGNFIVSDWVAGKIYEVRKSGDVKLALDGIKGSADIGLIPDRNLIVVPRMNENQVDAYRWPN